MAATAGCPRMAARSCLPWVARLVPPDAGSRIEIDHQPLRAPTLGHPFSGLSPFPPWLHPGAGQLRQRLANNNTQT